MSAPRRLEYKEGPGGPIPVYATGEVEQPWSSYHADEHRLWGELLAHQSARVKGLACPEFVSGLATLELTSEAIPRFEDLSLRLRAASGWTVVGVEGLLPAEVFFGHLAARRFPVTWWLRRPEQRDYIAEPDLFHDLFGHLPMMCDRRLGDFVQAYAAAAIREPADSPVLVALTRLYWYTVEFGLWGTLESPRLSGAGLLSSASESAAALGANVVRRPAEWQAMMRQPYLIDRHQPLYFVLPSFDRLCALSADEWRAQAQEASSQPDLPLVVPHS